MFLVIRIIAAIFLLGMISGRDYLYSVWLRLIICAVSIYGIWFTYKVKKFLWLVIFCIIAVIFNPFVLIEFNRQIWIIIALISAILFLISIFLLKSTTRGKAAQAKKAEDTIEDQSYESHTGEETAEKEKRRPREEREIELWEKALTVDVLNDIRQYIVSELSKIKETDWGDFALRAICTHSPGLSELIIDKELNIEYIKENERKGINDAINSIQLIFIYDGMTLRDYFHKIFEEIYKYTKYAEGNKFYWYGRDRVITTLRSYSASINKFLPTEAKFYDIDGEELKLDTAIDSKILKKVKESLDMFEGQTVNHGKIDRLKEQYRFKIESEYPVMEFDLGAIEKTGNFKYEGSLVNCLFIELQKLLYLVTDYSYLETRGVSKPLFDFEAASFAYETGIVALVKYKGVVEYFPDRLYVELQNVNLDSWIVRWLKSYKLHVEGND